MPTKTIQGEYVSLCKTPGGNLEMVATPQLREESDSLLEMIEDEAMAKILKDHMCEGWHWIFSDEIEALTDAPIISDTAVFNDNGRLVSVGQVYYDDMYQIRSTVETLINEGKVVWIGLD